MSWWMLSPVSVSSKYATSWGRCCKTLFVAFIQALYLKTEYHWEPHQLNRCFLLRMTIPTSICLFGKTVSEIPIVMWKHLLPYFSKTNLIHCPLLSVISFSNLTDLYCFLSPPNILDTFLNPYPPKISSKWFTNSCFSFFFKELDWKIW